MLQAHDWTSFRNSPTAGASRFPGRVFGPASADAGDVETGGGSDQPGPTPCALIREEGQANSAPIFRKPETPHWCRNPAVWCAQNPDQIPIGYVPPRQCCPATAQQSVGRRRRLRPASSSRFGTKTKIFGPCNILPAPLSSSCTQTRTTSPGRRKLLRDFREGKEGLALLRWPCIRSLTLISFDMRNYRLLLDKTVYDCDPSSQVVRRGGKKVTWYFWDN